MAERKLDLILKANEMGGNCNAFSSFLPTQNKPKNKYFSSFFTLGNYSGLLMACAFGNEDIFKKLQNIRSNRKSIA